MGTGKLPGLALGLVTGWMLAQAPALQAQKLMYRYLDEHRSVVLDDHVPPEYVGNGYTVLAADGRVIEEVPPALGPEERRARDAADSAAERERMWDESLLRRYSTEADIEAARERALREIEARADLLKGHLLSLKTQIEREQSRAADLERRGVAVSDRLQSTIEALRAEVAETEQSIQQRHLEADRVRAAYQRDIDRFSQLLQRLPDQR